MIKDKNALEICGIRDNVRYLLMRINDKRDGPTNSYKFNADEMEEIVMCIDAYRLFLEEVLSQR